jgi:hypothetical protein
MEGLRICEVLVTQGKVDSESAFDAPATLQELDEAWPNLDFALFYDQ